MFTSSERTFHFFHYKHATLHYTISGSGINPMLSFHGFGLTGESFSEVEKSLATEYTFYNFDLFFHGKSEWKAGEQPLTEEFWSEIITAFLIEKNITRFYLLGYSIGAKPIWSIIKNFSANVNEVIVIAPDGLFTNFWYSLATCSALTRGIFKLFLTKPFLIHSFLKIGRSLKIVPSITARFAESQLRTVEQRRRVFGTWMVYRKLKADKVLIEALNNKNIPLTIYLGSHDRIISFALIKKITDKLKNATIIKLEASHSNLLMAVVNYLKNQQD